VSVLSWLWLTSLAISGLALCVLAGLIIGRRIGESRAKKREAERRALMPLLIGGDAPPHPFEGKRHADLLTDLSTELIQLVRGTDKEEFVAHSTEMGVPERLRQRLDHGSPRKRLAAAEALADYADADSQARLNEALEDPNADVRLAAALALAESGRAPTASVLVEKLGIGSQENSMLAASLFQEIAKDRPDEIKALVQNPAMPTGARLAAIEALCASGDYSLVPVLSDMVLKEGASDEEMTRYLRALGEFGHPAAREAVARALSHRAWWVRASAAEAAGRIGLVENAETLRGLLGDDQWWVRFRAGEALMRLGEEGRRILAEEAHREAGVAGESARAILSEQGSSQ